MTKWTEEMVVNVEKTVRVGFMGLLGTHSDDVAFTAFNKTHWQQGTQTNSDTEKRSMPTRFQRK
jgi:hypothetical protein